MGLIVTSDIFQDRMNDLLRDLPYVFVFLDDILIIGNSSADENIKDRFLKDRKETKIVRVPSTPSIGVICGLWANSLGMGGVLSIETKRFPSTSFLELKLTGMQGDVMKESMNG